MISNTSKDLYSKLSTPQTAYTDLFAVVTEDQLSEFQNLVSQYELHILVNPIEHLFPETFHSGLTNTASLVLARISLPNTMGGDLSIIDEIPVLQEDEMISSVDSEDIRNILVISNEKDEGTFKRRQSPNSTLKSDSFVLVMGYQRYLSKNEREPVEDYSWIETTTILNFLAKKYKSLRYFDSLKEKFDTITRIIRETIGSNNQEIIYNKLSTKEVQQIYEQIKNYSSWDDIAKLRRDLDSFFNNDFVNDNIFKSIRRMAKIVNDWIEFIFEAMESQQMMKLELADHQFISEQRLQPSSFKIQKFPKTQRLFERKNRAQELEKGENKTILSNDILSALTLKMGEEDPHFVRQKIQEAKEALDFFSEILRT